jgi:hypothetical protein
MTEAARERSAGPEEPAPAAPAAGPSVKGLEIVDLAPTPPDEPHLIFVRGKTYPRAIAWLGFRSFWGHLFHLAASVIATEDIDARDWMHATPPDAFTRRIADAIGAGGTGETLTEMVGDELWIDFVADTGDASDVSRAVADMMFQTYRLPGPDGETLVAPRGALLVFGGDTAYPVATELEIHNRVSVPFNRVLVRRQDGRSRALLGVPGNHDWYDGLDGFARMFRARRGSVDRTSIVAGDDTTVDRTGQLDHFIDWVEAFRVGTFVAKRAALPLLGYVPLQEASYWAVRLAPRLELWGIDRQLRAVDYTQRAFFAQIRATARESGLVLCIADPVYTMLEPYQHGQATLEAIEVDLEADAPLVLTGDTHHYCRQSFGGGLHVVAGGGGAFLHPARIARRGLRPPVAEFPGPRASLALAMQVPWQIAGGRAGFIVHAAAAVLYLPVLGAVLAGRSPVIPCAVVAVLGMLACGMLGGWRQRHPWLIVALAAGCGVWLGGLPYLLREIVGWAAGTRLAPQAHALLGYFLSIYPAALGFGTFLMVLTLLGLEQTQAFSALAHPGYKHFVRARVRRDGSAVDGWVIGKVDTLDPDAPVVLVDRWTWKNPRAQVPEGGGKEPEP